MSATRTPQGALILKRGAGTRDLLIVVAVIALLLMSGIALLRQVRTNRPDMQTLVNTVSLFTTAIALSGFYLVRRRLQRASLLVHPWPVRLGQQIELKFRATMRSASPVTEIAARLVCAEEVREGGERSKLVARVELFSIDLTGGSVQSAGPRKVENGWTIRVPDSLPPSLSIVCHTMRWLIVTETMTEDVRVPAEFELLVLPEVVGD